MNRFLHKFDTNEQRSQYEGGGGYITPYTSLVYEDDAVHYNVFKAQLKLANKRIITIPQNGNNTDSALTSGEVVEYKEDIVDVVVGNRVKTLGANVFSGCTKLENIDLSDSVITIGNDVFNSCKSLTSVTISSFITSMGIRTFAYCNNLANVTILATTPPTLGASAFWGNASGRKIYVPSESVETYKAATNWSTYASAILPIPTE